MSQFNFSIPTNVSFGVDSVLRIGDYVKKFGDKVLLVTEQIFYETQYIQKMEKILKSFSIECIVYDEVTPDSGSEDIANISILTRTARADVVIGLGGQKCLNIAKAVSLFANNEQSFYYYIINPDKLKSKIPVILIPTTPRDYFALTNSIYYKDQDIGVTKIFTHKMLYADYLLIDPTFTADISKKIVSSMMLEMMGYASDALLSKKSSIFTETLLFKSIETINNNFYKILDYPDELEYRKEVSLSGLFLMLSGQISEFLICEGLSLAINSLLKIPKVIASTIILPHVLEFYIPVNPEKILKMAQCLSINIKGMSSIEASLLVVEHVQKIINDLKLPKRLSFYNVEKEYLWKIVDHAFEFSFFYNSPRLITKEDIFNILYASL